MKAKTVSFTWAIAACLLLGGGVAIAISLTPKPGDGTAVLDLNSAPGDQNARILGSVKPNQKVDVQVVLNQEIVDATGFLVAITFDPKKLSLISGKGDGVFSSAIFPGPPQPIGNSIRYSGATLGQKVIGKGGIVIFTFQALSGFSGDTEIVMTELSISKPAGEFKTFSPQASIVVTSEMLAEAVVAIPGDLNRDGAVDFNDFFIFATNFGRSGPKPTDEAQIITQTVTVHDTTVVTKTVRDTIRINASTSGVRYAYTFDNTNDISSWSKGTNGTSRVEAGKVILGSMSGKGMDLFPFKIFAGDIDVEVATEWKSGVDNYGYGVEFKNSQNGLYVFLITGNGSYRISKVGSTTQNNWVTLVDWTSSPLISRRGKNTLKVVTIGNLFKFFINGTQVNQISDNDFKQGYVGLRVEDVQEVAFDDLVIIEPNAVAQRDTVIVTKAVHDTVFTGGLRRDTVYVSTDQQVRPPIRSWDEVVKDVRSKVYWLGVTTWNSNDPIVFIGTGFAVSNNTLATNIHVSSAVNRIAKTFKAGVHVAYVAIKADGQPTDRDMYYLNLSDDREVLGLWHPEYDGTVSSPDVMIVYLHKDEKKQFESYSNLIGMRDAKELNVGDEISTFGFPGNLEVSQNRSAIRAIPTFKTGTISALRPYKTQYESANPSGRVSDKIIQHNFNTTPGTSGSPIFNRRGEVIAIHNAGSTTEASLGFGIRADEIRDLLQALSVDIGSLFVNAEKPAIPKQFLPKETGGQ